MGVRQTSPPFEPRAAQNLKYVFSISSCLDIKFIGGAPALQVKAEMKSKNMTWLNAALEENGGMYICICSWAWARAKNQSYTSLTYKQFACGTKHWASWQFSLCDIVLWVVGHRNWGWEVGCSKKERVSSSVCTCILSNSFCCNHIFA